MVVHVIVVFKFQLKKLKMKASFDTRITNLIHFRKNWLGNKKWLSHLTQTGGWSLPFVSVSFDQNSGKFCWHKQRTCVQMITSLEPNMILARHQTF